MYNKTLIKNLFAKKIEQVPTRNGYGDGLVEAGKKDPNVLVLCCDLTDSTRSKGFKEKYPDRFLEIGVAEQNMAGVAAGLALEGKIPFCSSYAVFNPGRNWDQVRVSVCYNKANVKIVGAHAGISVGPDGATHQALEDLAITRVLPNMTVLAPCDYLEAKKATLAAAKLKGPVYLRFAREKTPVFTTPKTPFVIGKAEVFKQGDDVTIIGCGPLVYEALKAAEELRKKKINAEVINCHTIKPIDEKLIEKCSKDTRAIITAEEHSVIGGLGAAVAEVIAEKGLRTNFYRMGIRDIFCESGDPKDLLEKYKLNKKYMIKNAKNLIKK